MLLTTSAAPNLVRSFTNYISLNESSIENAKDRFLLLKEDGVIRENSEFKDDVWHTTDEYANIGLYFKLNPFAYKNYENIFHMNLTSFTDCLKAFMVSLFGRNALSSIQTFLLDIRHLIETKPEDVYGMMTDLTISLPTLISEFLTSLQDADSDAISSLSDAMDSYADINMCSQKQPLQQRQLSDFETYFKFDDIMTCFWDEEKDQDTRLFYFPLYMWWKLTAVIPLRPREFLLTKRDCLKRTDDPVTDAGKRQYRYLLTLRRNNLKGGRQNVTYHIDHDYFETTYPVPDYIGEMIEKYIEETESLKQTDLDTLFVTSPHYKKWATSAPYVSRFLTYTNLSTILRYFYEEIITERYGYIVSETAPGQHLKDKEISFIHLGDTRHLALINLMQEGGTPAAAMFLAGHTNMTMASAYYSNIETLIECKTYRAYRKMIADGNHYQLKAFQNNLTLNEDYTELPNKSRCYSMKYRASDFSDCLNSIGPSGELGYCSSCNFHRDSGIAYFASDDVYRHRIEDDCKELLRAVELVRKDRGEVEEIGQAMLKIHSSSASYQEYLMEKNLNKEKNV
jgi:hypothetical protein